jgi:hypothetical protein
MFCPVRVAKVPFRVVGLLPYDIIPCMTRIQFPDSTTEVAALGFLAGRCTFKSFDDGTTLVPEGVLGLLAAQGIRFTVEGKAAYEQFVPSIRDSAPAQIQ